MPYENLLSSDERQLLLAELERFATDDILLAAIGESQSERARHSAEMTAIKKKRNSGSPTLLAQSKDVEQKSVVESAVIYTEPPSEAAARVTTATVETIRKLLNASNGAALADINTKLKSTASNTERVLKLLWKRGVVVYDGERYFIA